MATVKFDIDKMNESFEKCLENEGLLLQPYTNGFRELLNFFTLLGTIFSFVAGDVADKVKILDGHCSGPNCEKYEVIAEAMQYERDQRIDKINTAAFASASRTVLRLHRAMEFIAKLFEALATTNENHIGSLTKVSFNLRATYLEIFQAPFQWFLSKALLIILRSFRSQSHHKVCG